MNTLSRTLLILAALFVGLWLRGGANLLSQLGLPFLALLALGLAVIVGSGGGGAEAKARLEDAYARWLEAWQGARNTTDREKLAPVGAALHLATQRLALVAPDRVLKSLMTAEREGFRSGAVAKLVIEMRRSVGRPSLTVRAADLERLLREGESGASSPPEPAPAPAPAEDRAPAEDQAPAEDRRPTPDPVSFLG